MSSRAGIPAYDAAGVDFIQKWVRSGDIFSESCTDAFWLAPKIYTECVYSIGLGLTPADPYAIVFPGCYIPSLAFLISTLTSGSSGRLTVDSVSNIGPHYARTLREWKRKFLSNWDRTILPSLQQQYNLDAEGLEIFKRKWICACAILCVARHVPDHPRGIALG